MKTKHTHLIILACCTLFAAAGCKPKANIATSSVKSELTLSNGGREIHLIADRPATFAKTEEDKFVLHITGHEVVINREQVLVDKTIHSPVPAGTKKFEVIFQAGMLTVKGDGAMIMETPFNK